MPSLVAIGPMVLENKSSMYFHYVAIISLDKARAWPNLNRLRIECFMSSMVKLNSDILSKSICEKKWIDTWTERQTATQIENIQQGPGS